jgi:23S rRNA (pseudouridine1915-N3)-methyltransferase
MLFRFVWVGKTRSEPLRILAEDYLSRLKRFTRCEITEVRESAAVDTRAGILEESKRIRDVLPKGALAVLLEVEGAERSSHDLAWQVEKWQNAGAREVCFIIGGANGVSAELKAEIAAQWSLSRLTLTHEMARVLLLEQLYRAYTILHGLPYQK